MSKLNTRSLFFIALFFSFTSSFSAQVTIKGKSNIADNKNLWLYTYSDYFAMNELLLDKKQLNKNQSFSFAVDINEIKLITLKSEKYTTDFFIEPGKNYEIILNATDSNKVRTFGKDVYFKVSIVNTDSTELNYMIDQFEQELDNFYDQNMLLFATKRAKQQVQKFTETANKKYYASTNSFLKNHIKYQLALLQESANYDKKELFNAYLNTPIQYNNPSYVAFFNSYYKQYLAQKRVTDKGKYLDQNINRMFSYPATMETLLAADTLLKNDTLRELVFIKIIYENYFDDKMNKQSLDILLNYIAEKGVNTQNRALAKAFIYKLTRLNTGKKAFDFKVTDVNSKTASLSDFKEKYVYVGFYADWCTDCYAELLALQKLHEKYGKKIEFISINLGEDEELFKSSLNSFTYKWKFFYAEPKNPLIDYYKIKALPFYMLIDPEGDIKNCPAKKPSEDIESVFKQLIKEKR